MTKTEFETLRDAAAEHLVDAERELFTVGADFAYDLMQSRISELEDRLRWVSKTLTITEENEEKLEAKLAICKEALKDSRRVVQLILRPPREPITTVHEYKLFLDRDKRDAKDAIGYIDQALAQLEGKAE